MAVLTTAEELAQVREALQALTTDSEAVVSFNVDGVQVSYNNSHMTQLQDREKELIKRLTIRNVRKRVTPNFSGSRDYLNL